MSQRRGLSEAALIAHAASLGAAITTNTLRKWRERGVIVAIPRPPGRGYRLGRARLSYPHEALQRISLYIDERAKGLTFDDAVIAIFLARYAVSTRRVLRALRSVERQTAEMQRRNPEVQAARYVQGVRSGATTVFDRVPESTQRAAVEQLFLALRGQTDLPELSEALERMMKLDAGLKTNGGWIEHGTVAYGVGVVLDNITALSTIAHCDEAALNEARELIDMMIAFRARIETYVKQHGDVVALGSLSDGLAPVLTAPPAYRLAFALILCDLHFDWRSVLPTLLQAG